MWRDLSGVGINEYTHAPLLCGHSRADG